MIQKQIYHYVDTIQNINFDYIEKIKAHIIVKSCLKPDLEKYKNIAKKCKRRNIPLFVSNDHRLMFKLGLRKLYISSYNKNYYKNLPENVQLIGSAHNKREILEKLKQGCDKIILSRLFQTKKKGYLGVIKFNLLARSLTNLVALGGIKFKNVKKLQMLNISGFASESELRKETIK